MEGQAKNNSYVKRVFNIGLRLFAICAVSALALSIVNAFTKPSIIANRDKNEKKVIAEMVREGTIGDRADSADETVESVIPVYIDKKRTDISLFVLRLKSPEGYGGELGLIALYKPGGEIVAVRLLENSETPGLGKLAEDPAYMKKFIGRGGAENKPVPRTKQMLETQGKITGAALTSRSTAPAAFDFPLALYHWMFGASQSEGIDSVSGATITFTAIADALSNGSEYVKKIKPISQPEVAPESGGSE